MPEIRPLGLGLPLLNEPDIRCQLGVASIGPPTRQPKGRFSMDEAGQASRAPKGNNSNSHPAVRTRRNFTQSHLWGELQGIHPYPRSATWPECFQSATSAVQKPDNVKRLLAIKPAALKVPQYFPTQIKSFMIIKLMSTYSSPAAIPSLSGKRASNSLKLQLHPRACFSIALGFSTHNRWA